jgi:hypothetical protein
MTYIPLALMRAKLLARNFCFLKHFGKNSQQEFREIFVAKFFE